LLKVSKTTFTATIWQVAFVLYVVEADTLLSWQAGQALSRSTQSRQATGASVQKQHCVEHTLNEQQLMLSCTGVAWEAASKSAGDIKASSEIGHEWAFGPWERVAAEAIGEDTSTILKTHRSLQFWDMNFSSVKSPKTRHCRVLDIGNMA